MRPSSGATYYEPSFPKLRTDGNPWGEVQEILCPANWLCPARAPQALQLLRWRRGMRTSPGTEWGCAVFRALLTYCLLGTSGLGLQTVPLFVYRLAKMYASLKKAQRSPFFSSPAPPGLFCRARVCKPRPAPAQTVAALLGSPCSRGLCAGRWPPRQAAGPSS